MITDTTRGLRHGVRVPFVRPLGWAFFALALCLLWLPLLGRAATATGTFPPGQQTRTTNITGPANFQQTTFTGTSGPWNYVMYPFTVNASGNYTASSTTATSVNTTWFVRGIFSPNPAALSTPLADHIVAVLAGGGGPPFTGTFTSVPLVAGQQYTMLVAYNVGSVPGELSTVTINGPGCVAIGINRCSESIPTLSEWGLLIMSAVMALAGVVTIRRRAASAPR